MKNLLFLICIFAILSTSFVSVVQACIEKHNTNQQIEISINQDIDQDDVDNESLSDTCCNTHCHNHMALTNFTQKALPKATGERLSVLSENATSLFIYGLKRPPKT